MPAAKKCSYLFSEHELEDESIEDTIDAINRAIEAYASYHPKNLVVSNAGNKQVVNDGTTAETYDALIEILDANPGLNCGQLFSTFFII